MKVVSVSISEVAKDNGCMSAARFTGSCLRCYRVMKCPNEQAKVGRADLLRIRKIDLLVQLEKVNALLIEAEKQLQDKE